MKHFMFFISGLLAGMALLAAPACAQYKCFYGNLHAHTHNSDGVSTPDSAYAYARNIAHIDVQALTEHNKTGVRPHSSGGGTYNFTNELYQLEKQAAANATVPGIFVALAGFEIGSMGNGGFGHVCVWDASETSPAFITQGELQSCYQWITDQGVPAQFNHPGISDDNVFNNLFYYPGYSQSVDLMEMFNSGSTYESYYLQALNAGWQIGVTGNQDNHDANWGNKVSGGIIPLTGIWADTLTKESILFALQSRRTFATQTDSGSARIQLSLTADGHWMGERVLRSAGKVLLEINAQSSDTVFTRLELWSNGQVSDSLLINQRIVSWNLQKDVGVGSYYFFVKVKQKNGALSWSSPVFIEVPPQDKDQVVTWPTPVADNGARIVFTPIDGATAVTTEIYNLAGARVWHYVSSKPEASVYWDGRDSRGKPMPNGVYVILVEQKSPAQTKLSKGKTMVSR